MKYFITGLFVLFLNIVQAQLPSVCAGKLQRHENFISKFVTPRNVDLWLPVGYSATKKYAVLYMQDGQMLFDSNLTWNKSAWDVDDIISKLNSENRIRDVIVVAIWNGGMERHSEYCPQKPFETLPALQQEGIMNSIRRDGSSVFNGFKVKSDDYLKFVITELKPFIDKTYSTHSDKENTFISGSSMGGLISIYAICEYPEIFGGAACLSTHWPVIFSIENNPMPFTIFDYLKNNLPSAKSHKIYFDFGTETLDKLYAPLQLEVDELMIAKGYTTKNWMTKEFSGADHSEKAWHQRFDIPVLFLLGKE